MRAVALVALTTLVCASGIAAAQDRNAELEALKNEISELRRRDAETHQRLDELERRLDAIGGPVKEPPSSAAAPAPSGSTALDQAVEALEKEREPAPPATTPPPPPPDLWARQVGGGRLRLVDISLDTLVAVGTSTATDDELRQLEAGAHDPDRRGFTLQQAELSLTGAVDPYLNGEAHIVYVPDGVELEEAFFTTQSLPHGLQLRGGYFFTEFGLINPVHPHAWDWLDQPIINSRLFGGDGLRSPGAQLAWLTPLPWFSELHVGVQNANEGETTFSFISGESIGGWPPVDRSVHSLEDLLYLARWNHSWSLTDDLTALAGVSGLYGPNSSSSDGDTWIYGADFKVRWRPADNFRGWPFFLWQSEASKRDYSVDPVAPGNAPARLLRDYGFYTQFLYGFRYGWGVGLRYEYATGNGESLGGRNSDPFRDDRHRVSPLVVWHPTEYSRFRLQYNYDNAAHLEDNDAHSVWLGAEILYGAHPAHKY